MEKGPSLTYHGPTLDPPLSRFGPKVNTNVQGVGGHEYFIPNKFGKYQSSDYVVKIDSGFQYIYVYTSAPAPPQFLILINI